MPRKRRHAKARTSDLDPATKFRLMAGEFARVRIPDWVALAQTTDMDAHLTAAWEAHGDALREEAGRHGFTPAGPRGKPRKGAAVTTWAATFARENAY